MYYKILISNLKFHLTSVTELHLESFLGYSEWPHDSFLLYFRKLNLAAILFHFRLVFSYFKIIWVAAFVSEMTVILVY